MHRTQARRQKAGTYRLQVARDAISEHDAAHGSAQFGQQGMPHREVLMTQGGAAFFKMNERPVPLPGPHREIGRFVPCDQNEVGNGGGIVLAREADADWLQMSADSRHDVSKMTSNEWLSF